MPSSSYFTNLSPLDAGNASSTRALPPLQNTPTLRQAVLAKQPPNPLGATASSPYFAPSTIKPKIPPASLGSPNKTPVKPLIQPFAPGVSTPKPTPISFAKDAMTPQANKMGTLPPLTTPTPQTSPQPISSPTGDPMQPTQPQPTPVDPYQAQYQALLDKYNATASDTSQMDTTQAQLNALMQKQQADESARTGLYNKALTGIQSNPEEMGLRTGQSSMLGQQYNRDLANITGSYTSQEGTLRDILAQEQAKRQMGLDTSKFNLDQLAGQRDYQQAQQAAQQAANKPIEINGNLVQRNPFTGAYEAVYQSPTKSADSFTLGEGQARYDANGRLIASGQPKQRDVREVSGYLYQQQPDGSWKQVAGTGSTSKDGTKVVKVNGQDYVQNQDGSFSVPDVPEVKARATELKTNALTSAQALLDKFNKGIGTSAVGGSRLLGLQYIPGTAPKDFQIQFDNLKSLLSLDNVKLLKGQGAVSDAERQLLSDASSKLNLAQSEPEFKKALEDIVKGLSGLGDSGSLENYATQSGFSSQEVQGLRERGRTDEQIRALIDQAKKSNDLSMSVKGSGMRTDRHNNPTAFTTDIARVAGLKEGIDYVKGDSFSDGRFATAKLLGDPVDQTIKVIDHIGFYTSSGQPRWTHTAMSKSKWDALSYEQKKNVIANMYQHEGGTKLQQFFA